MVFKYNVQRDLGKILKNMDERVPFHPMVNISRIMELPNFNDVIEVL